MVIFRSAPRPDRPTARASTRDGSPARSSQDLPQSLVCDWEKAGLPLFGTSPKNMEVDVSTEVDLRLMGISTINGGYTHQFIPSFDRIAANTPNTPG